MSGHSKWATTKRAKAVNDAKKGAIFTRIGRLIAMAARDKGGDPETNFSLRMAIDKAKQANMPKDNIDKAIKRGTGELQGEVIEELTYEGFGPAKAQFIVKTLTDNKNRSAANIRHMFSKCGGSLGSVMWNFEQRGVIRISNDEFRMTNDEMELMLIEAGAQDIIKEEEGVTIITDVDGLQAVKKLLEEKKIQTETADTEYVAKEEMKVEGEDKAKLEAFIEELDDNEDVSNFYTNANI